ncbi:MAG: hypothetical protein QN178_13430 [Armatimonadota bacterium]|nr:hypothetical protein [Armatimonadota bacterium]
MDWGKVWRTLFCGWEAEIDFAALARELADLRERTAVADERDTAWVCRQIQEAY